MNAAAMPCVALAGQPNTGKSTLFNALTGLRQQVGNWPGRTVDRKTGLAAIGGRNVAVVDLPGHYGLTAASEEERIARDYLLDAEPDAVVLAVSATSLGRSLGHALDAALLGAPVVLAVTMADIAEAEGLAFDAAALERAAGLPVVALNAVRGVGTDALQAAIAKALDGRPRDVANSDAPPPFLPTQSHAAWRELRGLLAQAGPRRRSAGLLALKILEGDADILAWADRELEPKIAARARDLGGSAGALASARHREAERLAAAALRRVGSAKPVFGRFDAVATHPLAGPFVALLILALAFTAGMLVGFPLPFVMMHGMFATEAFVNGLLSPFSPWLGGLGMGMVRGVGVVVCLTPFLVVFYAIFALLEDVGYLARIAYVMDGPMSRIGLTGKSFVALLFSLPCNVAGVSAGRICDTERQRKLTAALAPMVPCSAKLAVTATLASWLFSPWAAGMAVLGVLVLNALLLGLAGAAMDRVLPCREVQHLVLELPRYQRPRLRVIAAEALARGWSFVRKAGTLIVSFCVLVWFFAYYPTGDIRTSLLGRAGVLLEPLGGLIGFDWRLITSLLTSVLNKEAVLATLAIIYDVPLDRLPDVLRAEMGTAQALSFMVAQSLFLPCLATLGVLRKECGSGKVALAVAGGTAVVALVAALSVYQALRLGG
jgi:ferrous iron transport protein B